MTNRRYQIGWIHVTLCLSVLATLVAFNTVVLSADRHPVPSAAELKQLQASVKEVFKADIAAAKSGAQQSEVAQRMLDNLQNEAESAGSDFALLSQAQLLAIKASHTELSLKIARLMSDRYQLDESEVLVQTLKELAKGPLDKEFHQELATKVLSIAAEQIAAERFEVAKDCYDIVSSIGGKLKSAELGRKSISARADLTELKKLADKLPMARSVLKNKADDATANETVAKYEIMLKGDWNMGFPFLAKASDTGLKQAAEQDLKVVNAATTPTPEEADAMSQRWWDLAQKQTVPRLKQQLKLRAGQWAEYAIPSLKGFSKTKAEQRLNESEWTANSASASKLMSLSRLENELETRMATFQGLYTKDFAICQAAKLDDALAMSKVLTGRKMRPIRFRPYWTADGPLVAAIWHRDEFTGDVFDGTEAEVLERDKAMRTEGKVPCDIAGYPDKYGITRYVLTSVRRPLKEKEELVVQVGWVQGTQGKPANERGMWMSTIHTWRHSDDKFYSDMILNKPVSANGMQWGNSAESNLKNIATHSKGNSLVGDVGVGAGENSGHYITWTELLADVTEAAGFDKSPEDTIAEWRELAANGFRPAMIAAAHDKEGKYYSFWTWRKRK